MRLFISHERREPNSRFVAARANLFKNSLHIPAEGCTGFQPVAHRWLISVVDLNVLELWRIPGDEVQIVPYVLGGHSRSEKIPRAPAGRRRPAQNRWMIDAQLPGQSSQQ